MERTITWSEIKEKVRTLPVGRYYGVPRGGQYIAALLDPVDTPDEADYIIDDLIDSGTTRDRYKALYPDKPFIALYEKTDAWLVFPWEQAGSKEIEENVLRIIEYYDNPNREGLKETPKRYIKFLNEFLSPPEFEFTCFENDGMDQMVVQSNIPFYSLCEHHLAPFYGMAHVAYVPQNKIVGLSKLARTVEYYSRRFQNQERITTQVANRLMQELDAKGVGVILEAEHLCVAMRGVKKPNTKTTTSALLGIFKEKETRNEFLHLIREK